LEIPINRPLTLRPLSGLCFTVVSSPAENGFVHVLAFEAGATAGQWLGLAALLE